MLSRNFFESLILKTTSYLFILPFYGTHLGYHSLFLAKFMVPTMGTILLFCLFSWYPLWVPTYHFCFLWYPFWVPRCHCLRFCGTHFGYHLSILSIYGTLFGYHFCPFLCCSWYPFWVPSWFFLPLWYPFWVPQNHVF